MSEKGQKIFVVFLCAVVFIISLLFIISGQRNIGPGGLVSMMMGLAGLVGLLWFYNRKYH